ncbi:hypothetical protein QTQ03_18445 [Micromonospora sp. WMMA1363]|uniref:hypothetical protein n=1 Tax=Micromonospora sp. WMMA1363 TaxID=3053985 RepID=UPI00259CD549|nr:hypothetical protein [Micromonospora sp. WMMA1363]MDM4721479.1 hypothetical protein [Micromonospora sp. WMMA1363]
MSAEKRAHDLMLWFAGRLPDDVVTQCRWWLAEGREELAVTVAAREIRALGLPLSPAQAAALTAAHREIADDHPRAVDEPEPPYRFTRAPAETDSVAADTARTLPGFRALWAVWRIPELDLPWAPARRVYLMEIADDDAAPRTAARMQRTLLDAGEVSAQVEVFGPEAALPPYQTVALVDATEIAAPTPATPPRLAAVFDFPQDAVPFAADHPRIESAGQRQRILDYLDSGHPLLTVHDAEPDVVEPQRGEVVTVDLRTDGSWIWSDASAYYLREHHLAPDRALLEHIRRHSGPQPELSRLSWHRAVAALRGPEPDTTRDSTDDSDSTDHNDPHEQACPPDRPGTR